MTEPPAAAGGPAARPPRGSRSNGLPAGGFVPLVDVDPRVGETLLTALARVGIAAYLTPVPGSVGGYLEVRLPTRPVDRLHVDPRFREAARTVVDAELRDVRALLAEDGDRAEAEQLATARPVGERRPTPDHPRTSPGDEEAAWQAIVAGWSTEASSPVPPWPVSEDLDEPAERSPAVPPAAPSASPPPEPEPPDDEEHYVPPPPPPVGRPSSTALYALVCVGLGALLLIAPGLLGFYRNTATTAGGVGLLAGAAGLLVWRLRDSSPDDPDDGAVV